MDFSVEFFLVWLLHRFLLSMQLGVLLVFSCDILDISVSGLEYTFGVIEPLRLGRDGGALQIFDVEVS